MKQTPVSMSNHFVLRDENIFPNALEFIPERWMAVENRRSLERYLVPFSKGSQSCLGQKYVCPALVPFLDRG